TCDALPIEAESHRDFLLTGRNYSRRGRGRPSRSRHFQKTPRIRQTWAAPNARAAGSLDDMNMRQTLALALDPSRLLRAHGLDPGPWQRDLLVAGARQVLLNCSRQSGKSTVASALALHTALFTPASLVLLVSPSLRQSAEIYRKVLDCYHALDGPLPAAHESA